MQSASKNRKMGTCKAGSLQLCSLGCWDMHSTDLNIRVSAWNTPLRVHKRFCLEILCCFLHLYIYLYKHLYIHVWVFLSLPQGQSVTGVRLYLTSDLGLLQAQFVPSSCLSIRCTGRKLQRRKLSFSYFMYTEIEIVIFRKKEKTSLRKWCFDSFLRVAGY